MPARALTGSVLCGRPQGPWCTVAWPTPRCEWPQEPDRLAEVRGGTGARSHVCRLGIPSILPCCHSVSWLRWGGHGWGISCRTGTRSREGPPPSPALCSVLRFGLDKWSSLPETPTLPAFFLGSLSISSTPCDTFLKLEVGNPLSLPGSPTSLPPWRALSQSHMSLARALGGFCAQRV